MDGPAHVKYYLGAWMGARGGIPPPVHTSPFSCNGYENNILYFFKLRNTTCPKIYKFIFKIR
jgi:hypothetical protein